MAPVFPSLEYFQEFLFIHLHSILLIVFVILGVAFRQVGYRFFSHLKARVNRSGEGSPSNAAFRKEFLSLHIERPLTWIALAGIWLFILEGVNDVPERYVQAIRTVFQAFLWLQIVRLAYLGAAAAGSAVNLYAKKTPGAIDDQLAPLLTKTMKVVVVLVGSLFVLQNMGVNVVSLVAGLGIGGLAIALAAQDLCANLLGSVTIIIDRPFQIGDYIKIGDIEGTVEEVGFRSTRLRTPTRTLLSVPNSTVARERIDNYQILKFRRMKFAVALSYANPLERAKRYRDAIEQILVNHPRVKKDDIIVRINDATGAGLQLNILFFTDVLSTSDELALQEEILFSILAKSEESETSLAYGAPAVLLKRSSDLNQVKNSL